MMHMNFTFLGHIKNWEASLLHKDAAKPEKSSAD
jgi:hypothetical protein